MPSPEMLHQRLRRRQANQRLRHETLPRPALGWSRLYPPRRRSIHTGDRHLRDLHRLNNSLERLPHLALKAEPENRIHHMTRIRQRAVEVVRERDLEVLQLRR